MVTLLLFLRISLYHSLRWFISCISLSPQIYQMTTTLRLKVPHPNTKSKNIPMATLIIFLVPLTKKKACSLNVCHGSWKTREQHLPSIVYTVKQENNKNIFRKTNTHTKKIEFITCWCPSKEGQKVSSQVKNNYRRPISDARRNYK